MIFTEVELCDFVVYIHALKMFTKQHTMFTYMYKLTVLKSL